jgi:hypothetical protein
MSGRKEYPISITNVQWQRMNREIATARSDAQTANRDRERAERDRKRAEDVARQRMQEMQSRCNQQINGLNRELQNQAQRQAEALRRTQTTFDQSLRNQAQQQVNALHQAQNDLNSRIQQQRTVLEQAMREQKAELERQLRAAQAEMQTEINNINNRMEAERKGQSEIANYWIIQARNLLDDIDSKYRHRLFKPGEWDRLNSRIRQAENNAANLINLNQAAFSAAQEVCNRAMDLRGEIIIAESEWIQTLNIANNLIVESTGRIERLEELEYTLQEDGEDVVYSAEVDYWSNGALSEAKGDIERLRGLIAKPDDLTIKDLQDYIAQIKHLDDKITAAAELAGDNFQASQLRRRMGADIQAKLPGWGLDEILFEGEDERKDLHLIFTHRNGADRLSLIIRNGQEGAARIVSDLFCETDNSLDSRDRWVNEVTAAINGYEPDARPVCTPEYRNSPSGNRTALDVESIKNGAAAS